MKLSKELKICLMVAVLLIFCFTPLGSIPIGPIVATLCMVPVVIAALIFGKNVGALMGFIFATCSFIFFTFLAPAAPTAFLFTPFAEGAGYKGNIFSLIICFVPRIVAGIMPAVISNKISKTSKGKYLADAIGAFVGSMTNTILFLLLAFLFFGNEYSIVENKSLPLILGITFLTNGIPEAVICAIVCPPIAKVLRNI